MKKAHEAVVAAAPAVKKKQVFEVADEKKICKKSARNLLNLLNLRESARNSSRNSARNGLPNLREKLTPTGTTNL